MEVDETHIIELDSDEDGEYTNTDVSAADQTYYSKCFLPDHNMIDNNSEKALSDLKRYLDSWEDVGMIGFKKRDLPSMSRFPFGEFGHIPLAASKLKAIGQTNMRKKLFNPKPSNTKRALLTNKISAFNFNHDVDDGDDEIMVVAHTTKGNNNYDINSIIFDRETLAKKFEDVQAAKAKEVEELHKPKEQQNVAAISEPMFAAQNDHDHPPPLLQQPTTVPSESIFLVPTTINEPSMDSQQPPQESIYFPSSNKLKQSTSTTGAGAVNENQTETGSAPLSLPAPAHSLIYIPEQFRAKYQALKNELNIKQATLSKYQNAIPRCKEFYQEKCRLNKVALENVISEKEAKIGDLQKTLDEVQKQLAETKSSLIREKDEAQEAWAKRIEAECENNWKKKMDMLTERDITLKRQQHVFELDREKMNYEETTSKQYEEQLGKMETNKDEQTEMLHGANAQIEELNNQIRAQNEAHSGQIGEFQKKLGGKEEAIRKLENEIIAAKNEANSERQMKEKLFDQLDNCHQHYGCQIAKLKKTLEERDEHENRQQQEYIKVALDALMKCNNTSNDNQRAGHGGNSSLNNSILIPQAEEYSTFTSSSTIIGGQDCTHSSLGASPTSSNTAAEAEQEQNETTAETFGWDVEFVEEVTFDYKMMPRMKKEGEDWTKRFVPVVTIDDDETDLMNASSIPKFNWLRHMEELKRRPPIKKEEPRNDEYEQQQPGTSAASENGNGKPKRAINISAMYLRERKRGPGLYTEWPVYGKKKTKK